MILINLNFLWFYFRINQVKGEIICEADVPHVSFILLYFRYFSMDFFIVTVSLLEEILIR